MAGAEHLGAGICIIVHHHLYYGHISISAMSLSWYKYVPTLVAPQTLIVYTDRLLTLSKAPSGPQTNPQTQHVHEL